MRDSIIHKILIHLYREDAINRDKVDITEFLRKVENENNEDGENLHRIKVALARIYKAEYALIFYDPGGTLGDPRNGVVATLENTIIKASFYVKGFDYTRQFIRDNEQHGSIIDTNNSFKKLNEEIIPHNNTLQRNMGYSTLVIAVLSMAAIAFSAYYSSQSVTSKDIKSLDTLLKNNQQLLQKMQQSQKGIDSSLRKAVKDSFSYAPLHRQK